MNYVGIDIHKRYSVVCVQDETGHIVKKANALEGDKRPDPESAGYGAPLAWGDWLRQPTNGCVGR